ncbi:MAG: hypothetical protein KA793_08165 [Bacteroidales bacterium]|nr:hypothetical protein [Bacteroidales bacterium]
MLVKKLSDTWLRAAVLGCLWASSEIVLGSLLHNLKLPFAGIFLTAIGIILLISVSYIWKDRGLIWRSGVICALMKAVSPSAVILSPMIAILFEALLLQLSVTIFRRNILAYLLGGMLAMSWTFVHKIAAYLILYGFNLVELYRNLTLFAQKQLHFQIENIWSPIIALWIFYLLLGLLAAGLGIYIGKKAATHRHGTGMSQGSAVYRNPAPKPLAPFSHSLLWLLVDVSGLIAALILLNFTHWLWWSQVAIALAAIWSIRYKSALRRLKKPGFWLTFVAITMLSSILFSKFSANTISWTDGLMIGLQMNVRAAIMIMGFAVIGTELSNPVIRNFFARTPMRQLTPALEIAFDTLPALIANLPDFKLIFRRPVSILSQIVMQSESLLEKIKLNQKAKKNIIIITGEIRHGKTTMLLELISLLKKENIPVGGIAAPDVFENNLRIGYDVINVATGERVVLSRITGSSNMIQIGKYYLHREGVAFGQKALSVENNQTSQLIVIDEIGPMELDNQGWAHSIDNLLKHFEIPMIFVVRSSMVNQVIANWSIENPVIIDVEKQTAPLAYPLIKALLDKRFSDTKSQI